MDRTIRSPGDNLSDLQEIIQLTYVYASALDSKDWPRLADCFLPDGTLSSTLSPEEMHGREAIASGMARLTGAFVGNLHLTSNHQYEIAGDAASGSCVFVSFQLVSRDTKGPLYRIHAGRYADRLKRTVSGWRFASRQTDVSSQREFA